MTLTRKLPSVIDTLIIAIRNGETDRQLAEASKQANPRKSKRSALDGDGISCHSPLTKTSVTTSLLKSVDDANSACFGSARKWL